MMGILPGVRGNLNVVLVCMSLITIEVDCFSICWSFVLHALRIVFILLARLLVGLFNFLLFSLNCLHNLDINCLSDI